MSTPYLIPAICLLLVAALLLFILRLKEKEDIKDQAASKVVEEGSRRIYCSGRGEYEYRSYVSPIFLGFAIGGVLGCTIVKGAIEALLFEMTILPQLALTTLTLGSAFSFYFFLRERRRYLLAKATESREIITDHESIKIAWNLTRWAFFFLTPIPSQAIPEGYLIFRWEDIERWRVVNWISAKMSRRLYVITFRNGKTATFDRGVILSIEPALLAEVSSRIGNRLEIEAQTGPEA